MEERRESDLTIIDKLNKIHTAQQLTSKDVKHIIEKTEENKISIKKIEDSIYGNGQDGLKSRVAVLHSRVVWLVSLLMLCVGAIVKDYIYRQ